MDGKELSEKLAAIDERVTHAVRIRIRIEFLQDRIKEELAEVRILIAALEEV